jgi:predicted membrane protein
VILGLVLVGVGVIWLLEALDVVSFSFLAVLPAALIIVGVALIGAARTGRHSGLIVLGVVLTAILTIASSFDIRLQGGVGERTERPTALADLQREYHLSVGQLTIDLRDVTFPDGRTTNLKASVGMGQLTVRVPDGTGLDVRATGHVGAGQVMLFGRQNSGLDVDLTAGSLPQGIVSRPGQATLTLDLSVGLGQIEVTR